MVLFSCHAWFCLVATHDSVGLPCMVLFRCHAWFCMVTTHSVWLPCMVLFSCHAWLCLVATVLFGCHAWFCLVSTVLFGFNMWLLSVSWHLVYCRCHGHQLVAMLACGRHDSKWLPCLFTVPMETIPRLLCTH